MKTLLRYKFHFIWIVAAVAAVVLHHHWNVNAEFMGIIETRTHKLGALESGRIAKIYPALGQEVHTNEVLAELDTNDLMIEQAGIERELQQLRDTLAADQHRYALEYDKLRLQADSDKRELAAKRAELDALNAEINRLTEAEQAGLGRSRDLAELIIRRDSVARYVQSETGAGSAASYLKSRGGSDAEPVLLSLLSERVENINELETELQVIEDRIRHRKIVSPVDGRVVKINYLPGDTVEGFVTILTVEEPTAEYLDVYIPETSDREPHLGERVAVHPHRAGIPEAHGTIVFIDPGYSAIPERLAFRRTIYWARKLRVKLDERHNLTPGEAAEVAFLGDMDPLGAAQAAAHELPMQSDLPGAPAKSRMRESLSEITVPDELRALSRFEPSGIAWLPDLQRYVLVSDDTSRRKPEHAPWLYLMDRTGKLEPQPVVLAGVDELNDVEAIAADPEGDLYLVSSQSISRKGQRKPGRQQLLRVTRRGKDFRVVGRVALFEALQRSRDAGQLAALGLGEMKDDQLVLNIEGAVWYQDELLLGLKQPCSAQGAIIWRLKNPVQLLETGRLAPDQLSLFAQVDLHAADGRPAGISDLAADEKGRLFALTTIAGAADDDQVGSLFQLTWDDSGAFRGDLLFTFPQLKPEGLCPLGGGLFTVVFDGDDRPPFTYLTTQVVQP